MNDFSKRFPEIHPHTFIADGAQIIGKVILKEGASVWYNSVLRADIEDILIGEDTNIQDNCVIHVEHGQKTVIGRSVTVGHSAVLHACTIGDNCIVGMGAILLDGSVIPKNSIVAAGSLVPPRKTYAGGSLILGSPAAVARKLSEEEIWDITNHARGYKEFWEAYVRGGIGRFEK